MHKFSYLSIVYWLNNHIPVRYGWVQCLQQGMFPHSLFFFQLLSIRIVLCFMVDEYFMILDLISKMGDKSQFIECLLQRFIGK